MLVGVRLPGHSASRSVATNLAIASTVAGSSAVTTTLVPVSALMIMTLGAEKGTRVVVTADDQAALDTVVDLVEKDLDAD